MQESALSTSLRQKETRDTASRPPTHSSSSSSRSMAIPAKRAITEKDIQKNRNIVGSCPTFNLVPRAPSARPALPTQQPPKMLLPPSPEVFSPVIEGDPQLESKGRGIPGKGQGSRARSRSLAFGNIAASAPAESHFMNFHPSFAPLVEMHGEGDNEYNQGGSSSSSIPAQGASLEQLDGLGPDPGSMSYQMRGSLGEQFPRRNSIDATQLGKSPTIFSVLSAGGSSHVPGDYGSNSPIAGRGRGISLNNYNSPLPGCTPEMQTRKLGRAYDEEPGGSGLSQSQSEQDGEDLMFAISFDQNDGDDSYLSNTMKDELHL